MIHALVVLAALLTGGPEAGVTGSQPAEVEPSAAALNTSARAHRGPAPAVLLPHLQDPQVRVWVDEGLDQFYPGDRVPLRFRTAADAYVAVLHLDTDGNVELLFPGSAWDDAFVRGHRTYSLPVSGAASRWSVGRSPGIGYFYVIASPRPLDLHHFRSQDPRYRDIRAQRGSRGDAWGFDRGVRGDPFWALDEITRMLVGDWRYTPHAVDYYSYHVGGRHRYPSYACYNRAPARDAFGYHYYPSCDRLQSLLVQHPHYYDTRRYRGDRQVYLREVEAATPRHGFKERPDLAPSPALRRGEGLGAQPRAEPRADPRGARPVTPPSRVRPERGARRAEPESAPAGRQRPTLERRPE
ncbi:MAG: DUF4384 domain-containing protein, partial [Gemmatimonadetes bacterium]|nr:DUF4384 domain-containing protein [Gemmatimonadota bacterium]